MNCFELKLWMNLTGVRKKKRSFWIGKKSQHNSGSHSLNSLIWRTYWFQNTHASQDVLKHSCSCSHRLFWAAALLRNMKRWRCNTLAFVKSLMSCALLCYCNPYAPLHTLQTSSIAIYTQVRVNSHTPLGFKDMRGMAWCFLSFKSITGDLMLLLRSERSLD